MFMFPLALTLFASCTQTAAIAAAAGATLWSSAYISRYGFYGRSNYCKEANTFRFGNECRPCSRHKVSKVLSIVTLYRLTCEIRASSNICPDGQYRLPCSGGSDSYCTPCQNGNSCNNYTIETCLV